MQFLSKILMFIAESCPLDKVLLITPKPLNPKNFINLQKSNLTWVGSLAKLYETSKTVETFFFIAKRSCLSLTNRETNIKPISNQYDRKFENVGIWVQCGQKWRQIKLMRA